MDIVLNDIQVREKKNSDGDFYIAFPSRATHRKVTGQDGVERDEYRDIFYTPGAEARTVLETYIMGLVQNAINEHV